ncbi:MAG: DUF5665 domain-containing protein [Clostridiales bacterium]|nr:DUF5665 domain-containing protein [Clostridiales bacterium]
MRDANKRLRALERAINELTSKLERSRFCDYLEYVSDTKRMLKRAFLSGLLRGLGMALGFSLLGALAIRMLELVAKSNIPYLAKLIESLVEAAQNK